MKKLISKLIEDDILQIEKNDGDYENILELIWFLANFGIMQIELFNKEYDKKIIEKKLYFIVELFYPYFTEKGLEVYKKLKYFL